MRKAQKTITSENYKEIIDISSVEHQDKVDWHHISIYQKLSEDFIREFQDYIGNII